MFASPSDRLPKQAGIALASYAEPAVGARATPVRAEAHADSFTSGSVNLEVKVEPTVTA